MKDQPNPTMESVTGRIFPCFPVAVQVVIVDNEERILLLSRRKGTAQVVSGG